MKFRARMRAVAACTAGAAAIGAAGAGSARAVPYAYIPHNVGGIAQYDFPSNVLSPLSPATVAGGTLPRAAVVSPDGTALYVVNAGALGMQDGTVSQFGIGSGGALAAMTPMTEPAELDPIDVITSPDGRSLYVADEWGKVLQYDVQPSGQLAPKSPASVNTVSSPYSLAFRPDGRTLYVGTSSGIRRFDVATDGTLSSSAVPAGTPANALIAVSPDGENLYAVAGASIARYAIGADGALVAAQSVGLPYNAAGYGFAVAADSGDLYIGVQDGAGVGNDVVHVPVDADGVLGASGTRVDAVSSLGRVVAAPDGDTIFAVSHNTATVTLHDIDGSGVPGARRAVTTPGDRPTTVALTPAADVRVTASAAPSTAGGVVEYTVTAHNDGPSPAPDVETTLSLPAETTFLSSTASQGTCSGTTTCALGLLQPGETATATIRARALTAGTWTANATVTPGPFDPDTTNQTTSAGATVTPEPRAVTSSASDVGIRGATLNGVVDPSGGATTFRFEYGTTDAYGSVTPDLAVGSTTDPTAVSSTIAGLEPETEYHFRVVAEQGGIVVEGADRTFTTDAVPPVPPVVEPVVITREIPVPVQVLVPGPTVVVPGPAQGTPRGTSGDDKPAPRSLSVRVSPRRDRTWPYRFRVRGSVALPSGVTRAEGCEGRITVALQSGRRTATSKRVSVSRRCTFDARLALGRSWRSKRGSLRVVVRFAGNDALDAVQSRSASVRYGR